MHASTEAAGTGTHSDGDGACRLSPSPSSTAAPSPCPCAHVQDNVDALLPAVEAKAREAWTRLEGASQQGSGHRAPVKAFPELQRFAFDVIAVVLMGDQLSDKEMAVMRGHFDTWLQNFFSPYPVDKWPYPFHNSMNARRWGAQPNQARRASPPPFFRLRSSLPLVQSPSLPAPPPHVGRCWC